MEHTLTIHSSVWPPGVVPSSELFAIELCTLLCSVVSGIGGAVLSVTQFVRPGGALAKLPSICRSAEKVWKIQHQNESVHFFTDSINIVKSILVLLSVCQRKCATITPA